MSSDNRNARNFLGLLAPVGLKQHVNPSAHASGHTLDLMIEREHDPVISSVPVADRYLSDHASVLCSLNIANPDRVRKIIFIVPSRQVTLIICDRIWKNLIFVEGSTVI